MIPSAKSSGPSSIHPATLTGWKTIAAYFGCNVRTVRRYEQQRDLPVHRVPGKKGGTVFAYASELDSWLESREKKDGLDSRKQINGTMNGVMGPLSELVQQPYATPAGEQWVKQPSIHPWQTWILFASALLFIFVGLVWMIENHQTVSASAPAKPEVLKSNLHVPAPAAEELFLRGRYFWNLRTDDGLARAIDSYTQAIVRDPFYAEAYAGLAEAYDLLPQFGRADLGDSLIKAETAADRAIELNRNLAPAHAAKAFALFYWDWDVAGSDAEFRRALKLDPSSALTHQWYASTLQCRGEGNEAMRQIDEAVRLMPTSAAIAADAAYFHADFGDFEGGVRALKEIERTQPTLASPALFLRELDFATGDYPGYIIEARRYASITHAPDDVALANAIERGWARAGKTGLLEERARVLKAAFDQGADSSFALGQTLLLLGNPRKALPYFRAALDRRTILLITMQACPWARGLSHDSGYAALFNQVHQRLHGSDPANLLVVPVSRRLPL